MKTCTRCKRQKDHEQFNRSSRSKDGRQSWCRPCTKEQHQKSYPGRRKNVRAKIKRDRIAFGLWLDSLVTGPCADCGLDLSNHHPRIGQWDHLPGCDKKF